MTPSSQRLRVPWLVRGDFRSRMKESAGWAGEDAAAQGWHRIGVARARAWAGLALPVKGFMGGGGAAIPVRWEREGARPTMGGQSLSASGEPPSGQGSLGWEDVGDQPGGGAEGCQLPCVQPRAPSLVPAAGHPTGCGVGWLQLVWRAFSASSPFSLLIFLFQGPR